MLSAMLARAGLRGDCRAFEGEAGFFPTYYGGRFHAPTMADGLGEEWYVLNVGLKPWPTTGVAHVFIEAAANLRTRHAIDPGAVRRVLVRGEPHIRTFCEPLETRRNPGAPVEAEDSVPFSAARALVSGGVSLADLQPTSEGLFDEAVVRVANLVDYEVDASLGKSGVVEVTLASGARLSERVEQPRGHRDHPLTDEQRHAKFRDCAAHAGTRVGRSGDRGDHRHGRAPRRRGGRDGVRAADGRFKRPLTRPPAAPTIRAGGPGRPWTGGTGASEVSGAISPGQ